MKITKRLGFLLVFLFVSIAVLGYFFNDYLEYKKETIVRQKMDFYLQDLLEKIKERKNIILTASVLLSNDSNVKKCLKEKKRINCLPYLQHVQELFDSITFSQDIKIHVHTSDFKSFFRVWDLTNESDSLVAFRESLQNIKETKKSISGIEIGRSSMLIRGISPIIDKKVYLGSIEVISDFEKITKQYKQRNIDFYVLMDKKYEKIAKKVKYPFNSKVDNYVVVNSINSNLSILEGIEFKETGYIQKENQYILYTPIYSLSNDKVGYYVLKILKSKLI